MQVNITFFVQLFNITITMWFLKHFFWKPLLVIVLGENKATAEMVEQKNLLENTLIANEKTFQEQKLTIIENVQSSFIKIHKNRNIRKCLEMEVSYTDSLSLNEQKITADATEISLLIQKKFSL
ncbi:ATP synthase F0 subunit B [Candidatus Dependentiae bacterium]|nr:ATP synthase F0 subunit B [Candidatus Dependentiae bacterium]